MDIQSLHQQLQAILGDRAVLADAMEAERRRADFMTRGPPPAVVAYPVSTDEVSAVLRLCHGLGQAVVPQGGLTGLAGGAVPRQEGMVALSLDRMKAIEEIDLNAAVMTVQAGAVLQAVQEAADEAGMLFPLDLGGRGSAQVGGLIGTNAGGNRVLRYGMMRDLVLGLEAVLPDGQVVSSLNKMLKNNTGYDLKQLFIGSEGTLGVVTRANLKLFPRPSTTATAICGLSSYDDALALLRRARAMLGGTLSAFEVMWSDFYEMGVREFGRRPLARPAPGLCAARRPGLGPGGRRRPIRGPDQRRDRGRRGRRRGDRAELAADAGDVAHPRDPRRIPQGVRPAHPVRRLGADRPDRRVRGRARPEAEGRLPHPRHGLFRPCGRFRTCTSGCRRRRARTRPRSSTWSMR